MGQLQVSVVLGPATLQLLLTLTAPSTLVQLEFNTTRLVHHPLLLASHSLLAPLSQPLLVSPTRTHTTSESHLLFSVSSSTHSTLDFFARPTLAPGSDMTRVHFWAN